jgi:hypothetical protein
MKGDIRVLEKIAWNLFVSTGDINMYLWYRNVKGTKPCDLKIKEDSRKECIALR